jgi:hypothetical protein
VDHPNTHDKKDPPDKQPERSSATNKDCQQSIRPKLG